jgi:YggT family protein
MTSGLLYILQSLMDLYLLAFALRLAMQWVRSDFRNPIVQFILTITNPIVSPLRKFIPPAGKLDVATAVAFFALTFLFSLALLALECQSAAPSLLSMLGIAALRGINLLLSVYLFMVFGYVILSWITMANQGGGYNPSLAAISNLLSELVLPALRPIRKFIPVIGGFDLSPFFLIILIGALRVTVLSYAGIFNTAMCRASGLI